MNYDLSAAIFLASPHPTTIRSLTDTCNWPKSMLMHCYPILELSQWAKSQLVDFYIDQFLTFHLPLKQGQRMPLQIFLNLRNNKVVIQMPYLNIPIRCNIHLLGHPSLQFLFIVNLQELFIFDLFIPPTIVPLIMHVLIATMILTLFLYPFLL